MKISILHHKRVASLKTEKYHSKPIPCYSDHNPLILNMNADIPQVVTTATVTATTNGVSRRNLVYCDEEDKENACDDAYPPMASRAPRSFFAVASSESSLTLSFAHPPYVPRSLQNAMNHLYHPNLAIPFGNEDALRRQEQQQEIGVDNVVEEVSSSSSSDEDESSDEESFTTTCSEESEDSSQSSDDESARAISDYEYDSDDEELEEEPFEEHVESHASTLAALQKQREGILASKRTVKPDSIAPENSKIPNVKEEDLDNIKSSLEFSTFCNSIAESALKARKQQQLEDNKRIAELQQKLLETSKKSKQQIEELQVKLENSNGLVEDMILRLNEDHEVEQAKVENMKCLLVISSAKNKKLKAALIKIGTESWAQKYTEEKITNLILSKELVVQQLKTTFLVKLVKEKEKKLFVAAHNLYFSRELLADLMESFGKVKRQERWMKDLIQDLELRLRITTGKNVLNDFLAKAQLRRQAKAKLVFKELQCKLHDKIEADERTRKEFERKLQGKMTVDERSNNTIISLIQTKKQNEKEILEMKSTLNREQARLQFLNKSLSALNCEVCKMRKEDNAQVKSMEKEMSKVKAKLQFANAKTSLLNEALKQKDQLEKDQEDRLQEMALKMADLRSQLRFSYAENELLTTKLADCKTSKEKNRKAESLEAEIDLLQRESSGVSDENESEWDFVQPETAQQLLE